MKNMKRMLAVVTAWACMLLMVLSTGTECIWDMPEVQAATEADSYLAEFLNSGYDTQNFTVYDGMDETNYFMMNGRKYYQGIVLKRSTNVDDDWGDGIVTFNVENVDAISFDLGRIDNTDAYGTTLKVYRNGEWWQDITMGAMELWKRVSFDLSNIYTLSFRLDTGYYVEYGFGDICVDESTPSMTYDTPEYTSAVEFMESAYDTGNYTIYDGSNEFNYFAMNGRKYYQGIVLKRSTNVDDDWGDGIVTFNVENVDSVTFTFGRIDDTNSYDTTLNIYQDGVLWYKLSKGAAELAQAYTIDTTDISTLSFRLDTGDYVEYALANIALNGDYSDFSDGTYAVNQTVYDDPDEIINLSEQVRLQTLGNVNSDSNVDSTDAALILVAAAMVGAGADSGLTDEQKKRADVNDDGAFDSIDASIILIFAAAIGSGQDAVITDFI